jgi:hypothetical protein
MKQKYKPNPRLFLTYQQVMDETLRDEILTCLEGRVDNA